MENPPWICEVAIAEQHGQWYSTHITLPGAVAEDNVEESAEKEVLPRLNAAAISFVKTIHYMRSEDEIG